jgi:hypothetical protein
MDGDGKSNLKLVAQPQDFFRELVTEALSHQQISTNPETEFYLVNLLNQFMKTDRLYEQSQDGSLQEQPLAFMIKEAIEQRQPQAQAAMFRRIGDVSLYTAGFFQDSLNRKLVDVDYYIDIGHTAYTTVASHVEEEILRVIYKELADKFAAFVDVLAAVSDKTTPKSETDLLRIYERWVRTGSDRAAKALQDAGIIPNKNVKKDWQ